MKAEIKESLPKKWTKKELFEEKARLKDIIQEAIDVIQKQYDSECYEVDWYNNNMEGSNWDYKSRPSKPKSLEILLSALTPTAQ